MESDPRKDYHNKFKLTMLEAPGMNMTWFCYACIPCTFICAFLGPAWKKPRGAHAHKGAHYQLRQQALGPDWPSKYTCCQGYVRCGRCFQPGSCGEQSMPEVCLCAEVICCGGTAMLATRQYVMDKYNIVPDPFDNKVLRCMIITQYIACILDIIAIFVSEAREASYIVNAIANAIFYLTSGCTAAQINYELFQDGPPGSGGSVPKGAPAADGMER